MPWTKPVEQSIAQNHAADFAFKVFPNPVVETATIQFNLDTPANIYLAVNDIVGKTVFEMNDPSIRELKKFKSMLQIWLREYTLSR